MISDHPLPFAFALSSFEATFAKNSLLDIIHPLAQGYAEQMSVPEEGLLKEISDYTFSQHAHPHMLSGQVQGRLLAAFSRMLKPTYILEIGTFTGYSALCLAEGLAENGELHTLEKSPADVVLAKAFFQKSPYFKKIHIHEGDALELIKNVSHPWDLVFIDADKSEYIRYYETLLPLLKSGSWILADNVLFHGQVLENPVSGKNARAIAAFNEHVKKDHRVEQVLLTVRDGLLLVRKK